MKPPKSTADHRQLKIDTSTVTYLRGGGLSPYSYVRALLTTRLGRYGTAITRVELYPRLPLPAGSEPVNDNYFDKWQSALDKLPYVNFLRKQQRFEIAFRSNHFNAADMDNWGMTADKIRLAGEEIADALQLVRKRLKSTDDFDVDRFLSDVTLALQIPIGAMEEWNRLLKVAAERDRAEYAAMSPWEQLDIDWTKFHPKAREVLDDPFFWDCVDEIAPHGNDTGADLFEDFQKWNKRNSQKSPLIFLEDLFSKWNIAPIDWHVAQRNDVLKLEADRPIELALCNEAAIALAFAVLKQRANCPADVAHLAMSALERSSILANASKLPKEIKSEWNAAIAKMKLKLNSIRPAG
jgi:uncharacterized protein YfeS